MSMERPSGLGLPRGSESLEDLRELPPVKSYGPGMKIGNREYKSPQIRAESVQRINAADLASEEALKKRIAEATGEYMGEDNNDDDLDTQFDAAFEAIQVPPENNHVASREERLRELGQHVESVIKHPKEQKASPQEGSWDH